MGNSEFKLGMGQMWVEGGNPKANLNRAVEMIEEAGRRGCRVLVLPECLDFGWTHPSARSMAHPLPGPFSERLASAAEKAGLYVVAGLVERDGSRLFNAAVLIGPSGELILKHRKINELTLAHDLYSIGDRLNVAKTPLGTL